MKKIYLLVSALFICFFIQSCATGKFTQTGNIYPPYNGPVRVFTSPPTDLKYEEIGWVSSSGGMIHEWTRLIESMQKKAASKGANAIIIIKGERPNSSMATYTPQYGFVGGSGYQKSMTAIAIRIFD